MPCRSVSTEKRAGTTAQKDQVKSAEVFQLTRDSMDMKHVLTTFSSHLQQRYRSPSEFSMEIEKLLRSKREKYDDYGYRESVERNLVFLYFFLEELKSLLEIMISRVNDDSEFMKIDPGLTIMDIEKQVREETGRKHSEIFGEKGSGALPGMNGGEEGSYMNKLEFHYSYLMAARSFTIDFINILYAAQREYRIEGGDFDQAWNYIDMSANYYIGNIAVGESEVDK
ncbi:MAG: hypothetical protein R6U43_10950 [Candidatus Krumholzibacteriales bacterium]